MDTRRSCWDCQISYSSLYLPLWRRVCGMVPVYRSNTNWNTDRVFLLHIQSALLMPENTRRYSAYVVRTDPVFFSPSKVRTRTLKSRSCDIYSHLHPYSINSSLPGKTNGTFSCPVLGGTSDNIRTAGIYTRYQLCLRLHVWCSRKH